MKHCGTHELETQRLTLRRFRIDDALAMYENWASDDEVTRFLTWPTHTGVDVTRSLLADWVTHYDDPRYYHWAIVLRDRGDEPIGSIAAMHMDDAVSMVHIGYCIGRAWWRQGIMTEALRAVMDFFFDTVGAERIEARHDTRNPHSGMVMMKCGMQYEGTLRRADRNNSGICDVSYYARLCSERSSKNG